MGFAGTSGSSGTSGDSGTIEFVPHSGVEYSGTSELARTIYNTSLDPTIYMTQNVGGIPGGTTVADLTGKTLVGIIDDLLFPTVLPTYAIPTNTISSSVSGTFEIGVTVNPFLTVIGTENDAGAFNLIDIMRNGSQIYSSSSPVITTGTPIIDQFGYANTNNPNLKYTISYTDSGYVIPPTATVSASSTSYNGNGSYNSGSRLYNNKGILDSRPYLTRNVNAPQLASANLTSSNVTLLGWYPYFYGKTLGASTPADIVNIIQSGVGFTKVVNNGAGTLTMAFGAAGEWPWFAIFQPFPNKTIWYDTALNTGSIGTSTTDLFSAPTALSVNSPSGYWTGKSYKIYVAQKVTTLASAEIRVI